jgi:hypothetical protein
MPRLTSKTTFLFALLASLTIGTWLLNTSSHQGKTSEHPGSLNAEHTNGQGSPSPAGEISISREKTVPQATDSSTSLRPSNHQEPQKTIDSAMIGLPFPTSPSVNATCQLSSIRDSSLCNAIRDTLSRLAEEPRDVAWANKIESELQDYIESKGFAVRDIECRQSLCAAEVTSVVGPFNPYFSSDAPLKRALFPQVGISGREASESGEPLTVTLLLYARL